MNTQEQMVKIIRESNPEIKIQTSTVESICQEIDQQIKRGLRLLIYEFYDVDTDIIIEVLRNYSNTSWNARIRAEGTVVKLILS